MLLEVRMCGCTATHVCSMYACVSVGVTPRDLVFEGMGTLAWQLQGVSRCVGCAHSRSHWFDRTNMRRDGIRVREFMMNERKPNDE